MSSDQSPGSDVDVRGLVEFLARGLVDEPEQVEVNLVDERDAHVYEIDVGQQDLGKIIGKGGKTARAIRTLVNCVAPRSGKRSLVEILE